jgi:hypothetical protein
MSYALRHAGHHASRLRASLSSRPRASLRLRVRRALPLRGDLSSALRRLALRRLALRQHASPCCGALRASSPRASRYLCGVRDAHRRALQCSSL